GICRRGQYPGQIVSGENGVGLAFQSCFVLVHGFFNSSLLAKGIPEIVMRIRVVRSQFECLSVMNDRLLDVAFLTERRADAVMALGVIEWKRERLLVLGDGGIDLAILQKRVAQVDVALRVTRPLFNRSPEMRYRLICIALLQRDRSNVALRVRIVG